MAWLRSRLLNKLIFAFVGVLLIPTASIAIYSSRTAADTLISKISGEELRAVVAQASTTERRLIDMKSDLIFLSQAPPTRQYIAALGSQNDPDRASIEAQVSLFQSFLKRATQYRDIAILDFAGNEIIKVSNAQVFSPLMRTTASENQSGYPYFNQVIGMPSGQVYISDFELNLTDGRIDQPSMPIIRYSTPLQANNGSVVGVLVVKAFLQPVLDDLITSDSTSETYLVDKDGSYLLHPDPQRLYGRILKNGATLDQDQPHGIVQLFGAPQGTLLNSPDRPNTLQVFAHIKPQGQIAIQWLVIRQKPLALFLTEVNNAQLVILILAGIALLMAITVALFLTRSIVGPVLQLAHTADAISRGEFDTPFPRIHTRDEISHLASAFEKMLREMKALYSDLEARVAARTAELEATNKQLVIAQERAEKASKAKSVFLSNMSHELRTPLNVVIGYADSMLNHPEMFEHMPLPEIYGRYIQLIETNGYYLLGLITDILDLSKIEAGRLELHFSRVDLNEIFRGVISTSIGLLKGKPVQIRPDFAEALPAVWADPLRVRQIVLNLMSNAAKFTDTGSITLSARVEGGCIHISVVDTGIGIPPKAVKYIFDRFQQAEHDTDKRYGGTGLGLDISKQLSRLHGSDLMVESIVGKGSIFSFNLPIATPEQVPAGVAPEQSSGAVTVFSRAGAAPMQTAVILVVEEETRTREALRRDLENAGYIVVDTSDGAQGLELARGALPKLIILDESLSSRSGWEVLQELKADSETRLIPVILCASEANRQRAADAGATYYVQKPITAGPLLFGVRQVLGSL